MLPLYGVSIVVISTTVLLSNHQLLSVFTSYLSLNAWLTVVFDSSMVVVVVVVVLLLLLLLIVSTRSILAPRQNR